MASKKNQKKPYKPTYKDQLGNGSAKKATKTVQERKAPNRNALSIAQKFLRQNGANK